MRIPTPAKQTGCYNKYSPNAHLSKDGYNAFVNYVKLKILFTEGRFVQNIKGSNHYFLRNDAAIFERLGKHNEKYVLSFLVGNLVQNPNMHISEMNEENKRKWEKNIRNKWKNAQKDLKNLLLFMKARQLSFDDLVHFDDTKKPILLLLAENEKISKETITIFEHTTGILSKMKENLEKLDKFGKILNEPIINKYFGYSLLIRQEPEKENMIVRRFFEVVPNLTS